MLYAMKSPLDFPILLGVLALAVAAALGLLGRIAGDGATWTWIAMLCILLAALVGARIHEWQDDGRAEIERLSARKSPEP